MGVIIGITRKARTELHRRRKSGGRFDADKGDAECRTCRLIIKGWYHE